MERILTPWNLTCFGSGGAGKGRWLSGGGGGATWPASALADVEAEEAGGSEVKPAHGLEEAEASSAQKDRDNVVINVLRC